MLESNHEASLWPPKFIWVVSSVWTGVEFLLIIRNHTKKLTASATFEVSIVLNRRRANCHWPAWTELNLHQSNESWTPKIRGCSTLQLFNMNTLPSLYPHSESLLRTSSNHCTAGNVRGQPAGVRIVLLGVSAYVYIIYIGWNCLKDP